jgi:hypothetical protein
VDNEITDWRVKEDQALIIRPRFFSELSAKEKLSYFGRIRGDIISKCWEIDSSLAVNFDSELDWQLKRLGSSLSVNSEELADYNSKRRALSKTFLFNAAFDFGGYLFIRFLGLTVLAYIYIYIVRGNSFSNLPVEIRTSFFIIGALVTLAAISRLISLIYEREFLLKRIAEYAALLSRYVRG